MSRCDPLNPLQLKRNREHSREQEEDINSSESERELDFLLNLFIDKTNEDDSGTDSDSLKSSEDEDLTDDNELSASFTQTKNRLSPTSSTQKIVKSGNNNFKESATEQEATKSRSESPYAHLPVVIKTEPMSPEPVVSKVIREPICMPTSKSWEGSHDFTIKVTYDESLKPANNAIYSASKNKLYISKDCEFQILFSANSVPPGSVIRATAFYTRVSDAFEVVRRCPEHVHEDKEAGKVPFEHLLQSFHSQASYERNEQSGRYSVVIPHQESEKGSEGLVSVAYKFVCWGSCIGGINRRPFMIHFTLEKKDVLLGRQVLNVKVCASPSRDLRAETEKHLKSSLSPTLDLNINSIDDNSPQNYRIITKDRKLYEFLKQMKALYETSAGAEYLMQIESPTNEVQDDFLKKDEILKKQMHPILVELVEARTLKKKQCYLYMRLKCSSNSLCSIF